MITIEKGQRWGTYSTIECIWMYLRFLVCFSARNQVASLKGICYFLLLLSKWFHVQNAMNNTIFLHYNIIKSKSLSSHTIVTQLPIFPIIIKIKLPCAAMTVSLLLKRKSLVLTVKEWWQTCISVYLILILINMPMKWQLS